MDYSLKYQKLILSIKKSKLNSDINKALNDIYKDEELIKLIKEYNLTKDENIRKIVYKNEKYIKYKKLENEVNMLIIQLNNIFKELGDIFESN